MSRIFVLLSLCILIVSNAQGDELYGQWGVGFTQYEAAEFNRMMELLAKRSADSSAGFNNFDVDPFNGHPYQVFEVGYVREKHRVGVEVEYWVEAFAQDAISFYTQRHKDERIQGSLNCEFLADPQFDALNGSITGCVFAQETFTFLPMTLQYSYALWQSKHLRWDGGVGVGYFFGKANIKVRTAYYAGRVSGDQISFDLDIGHNPIYKIQSSLLYKPLPWFGFELRAGFRWSQIEQLKVTHVKGSSEIFQIVMGKPIVSGQRVYIESYPGLEREEDELSLLEDTEMFKDASYYNSVQGDLTGFVLSLRLQLGSGGLW